MNETTEAMRILNQIPWHQATATVLKIKDHPEIVGQITVQWDTPETIIITSTGCKVTYGGHHEIAVIRKLYRIIKTDPDFGSSWEWVKSYCIQQWEADEVPLTDDEYLWLIKQTDKCK